MMHWTDTKGLNCHSGNHFVFKTAPGINTHTKLEKQFQTSEDSKIKNVGPLIFQLRQCVYSTSKRVVPKKPKETSQTRKKVSAGRKTT